VTTHCIIGNSAQDSTYRDAQHNHCDLLGYSLNERFFYYNYGKPNRGPWWFPIIALRCLQDKLCDKSLQNGLFKRSVKR
jgi:hypothetical protein